MAELRSGSISAIAGATTVPGEAVWSAGAAGACSYFTGSCNQPWVELCYHQSHTKCLTLLSPTPTSPLQ